jgi:hypothetical protein
MGYWTWISTYWEKPLIGYVEDDGELPLLRYASVDLGTSPFVFAALPLGCAPRPLTDPDEDGIKLMMFVQYGYADKIARREGGNAKKILSWG